jgi:hypothetical protein
MLAPLVLDGQLDGQREGRCGQNARAAAIARGGAMQPNHCEAGSSGTHTNAAPTQTNRRARAFLAGREAREERPTRHNNARRISRLQHANRCSVENLATPSNGSRFFRITAACPRHRTLTRRGDAVARLDERMSPPVNPRLGCIPTRCLACKATSEWRLPLAFVGVRADGIRQDTVGIKSERRETKGRAVAGSSDAQRGRQRARRKTPVSPARGFPLPHAGRTAPVTIICCVRVGNKAIATSLGRASR